MRSKAHLARVRALPCLVCQKEVPWKLDGPSHAHHTRVGLRTMGVRKDDTKTLPLCSAHHDELHSGKEESFWQVHGIDPLKWCEQFLENMYGRQ